MNEASPEKEGPFSFQGGGGVRMIGRKSGRKSVRNRAE
jgi:hypothetical protein